MDLAEPKVLHDKSVRLNKVAARLDRHLADTGLDPGILSLGGLVLRSPDARPAWGDLGRDHSIGDDNAFFDLVGDAGVASPLADGILATMRAAGQLDYLTSSGILTGPDGPWEVVVEVHYYRKRSPGGSNFHKDTLGQTLFVNLNYVSDSVMAGPEYVVNPAPSAEHDKLIARQLPPSFMQDLADTRERLPTPTVVRAPKIEPNGAVAFVDEVIHHMTPKVGPRLIDKVVLETFVEDPTTLGVDAVDAGTPAWQGRLAALRDFLPTIDNRPSRRPPRSALRELGIPDDVIDRAIAATTMNLGYEQASIPRPGQSGNSIRTSVLPEGAPPLVRETSQRVLRGKKLPGEKTKEDDRTFFRTWVRARRVAAPEER